MFRKIINLFKMKKVPRESSRIFDMTDWHPLKERYETFRSIIEDALYKRDNNIDGMHELEEVDGLHEFKCQRYMIENIVEAFETDVPIEKIKSLDVYCSGHVDYVHKFALRLAEYEANKIRGYE